MGVWGYPPVSPFVDTAEGYVNAEAIICKAIDGQGHELSIAIKVSGDDHSTGAYQESNGEHP